MMAGKSRKRAVERRDIKIGTKENFAVYLAVKQLVLLEYIC